MERKSGRGERVVFFLGEKNQISGEAEASHDEPRRAD
jgi:hypothetical protein